MVKKPTISEINSAYASQGKLNSNFQNIYEAFDNTLSRDGSEPNNMLVDLDMDGNDLLNVGIINAVDYRVNGKPFGLSETITEASNSVVQAQLAASLALTYAERAEAAEESLLKWQGAWVQTRAYKPSDLVRVSGSTYVCVVEHISGIFNTDLVNGYWQLFAEKGQPGAGTGDMVGSNNLTELTDEATARQNLGLGTLSTGNTATYMSNQTQWNNGVDNNPRWISPLMLQNKLNTLNTGNTPDFTSVLININPGGFVEVQHQFGFYPSQVEFQLVCQSGQHGYVVGDRIPIITETNSQNRNRGMGVAIRTNTVAIRFSNDNSEIFEAIHLNTGTRVILTNSNWKLLVTVWK